MHPRHRASLTPSDAAHVNNEVAVTVVRLASLLIPQPALLEHLLERLDLRLACALHPDSLRDVDARTPHGSVGTQPRGTGWRTLV